VVREYVGGYADWLRQRDEPSATRTVETPAAASKPTSVSNLLTAKRKLSYKDQRELEQLPSRIDELEAAVAALSEQLADPAIHAAGGAAMMALTAELTQTQSTLDAAYARWAELDS
jgi:ATP-binding cassette subfamily F protein uup